MSVGVNDNLIALNFGEPVETDKIKADINMKIDKNVELFFPFQKSESSPFTIELTLQAKLGKADSLARLCEKLLNPKKRFKPIHPAFYLAIQDNHIKVKVTHDFSDKVHVVFIAGEKFRPLAESFFSTFKKFGFANISDRGFNFHADYSSGKSCLDILERFADKRGFFYQTFLQDSALKLRFSNESKAWDIIDLFWELACENNNMYQFSDFEEIDIEAFLDLYDDETKFEGKKNWLFQKVEDFFTETVALFNGLNDKELKQLVKVKTLLQEKMVPKIEISLSVHKVIDIRAE